MDVQEIPTNGLIEVLPPEAIMPPALPVNGTLMSHCGTEKIGRQELALLPVPMGTETFQPIPHNSLIDAIEESLAYRHIRITRDEYAVSKDGMKMFGLLELDMEYSGINFAIGLRNANDKSMRLGMVAGYRVFVCDNMSLSGDFKPMLAKHTKHLDLIESVSMGVDRIQRNWQPLREDFDRKRTTYLSEEEAKLLIYKAFMENKFPITLMKEVHSEFFNPSYDFGGQTAWNLENAFTTAFKKLNPVAQFQQSARLGKFLN
jgi:Domain of unknown function (DUF932)